MAKATITIEDDLLQSGGINMTLQFDPPPTPVGMTIAQYVATLCVEQIKDGSITKKSEMIELSDEEIS